MDHVISGVAKFQRDVYPEKKETFKNMGKIDNGEVFKKHL